MSEGNWNWTQLSQVASVITKGTTPTTYGYRYTSDGIPFLRVENLTAEGWIDLQGVLYIDARTNAFLARSQLAAEDLLVSIAGTIGRTAVVSQEHVPANCNQAIALIRIDRSKAVASFIHRFLASVHGQRAILGDVVQLAQANLSLSQIAKTRIPLPPLPDQRRIAAVLDIVDEVIVKTEAVITKLKQMRTGLLHNLLTRGLDEHGQLRDPIAHPEQFQDSPLGQIPREWAVLTIEALLARVPNALRSGPFGSALLKQELKESGIPLLGIDNVHIERFVANYTRFVDDDKFVELRRYAVRAGDVMITIMGTVGRCCVVPDSIGIALSSKHVWTITLDQSRYSPHVACWQMNFAPWVLRQFKRDEQGGVMTAIRSETLRQLLLPVPPLPEIQVIETILLQFNKRIGEEDALLSKLAALKSGLMSDLLTGRVRVPEGVVGAS